MARLLRRARLLGVAVFFALVLLVTGVPTAGAATLVVDDNGLECPGAPYTTISAAVAAAGPNDTIQVCAGSYNESVTVSFPLTFKGPNAGIPWSGSRGAEANVTSLATTFNLLNGQDVTIDGFTITGNFGIYAAGSTAGTLVENNIVTGITRALTLDAPGNNAGVIANRLVSNVRSLHLSSGPYTSLKVNSNRFEGTGTIFFNGNSAITGLIFKGNEVFQSSNLASNITNGTIGGNTFDAPAGSLLDTQMSLHFSSVSQNIFRGRDVNACFQLFGSQFGLVPSHDVTIRDNTFTDCGGPAPPFNFAIQLSPDIFNITITQNAISNGFEGVNTRDATPWVVPPSVHVNLNNITDNTSFGVRNGQMGVLDAECNWWGAADGPGPVGPGSGDNVSTNVDFTPWLIAPAPGGKCLGGAPSTPGKVTGGGQIQGDPVFSPLGDLISIPALIPSASSSNSQSSFGFSVRCCAPAGNLQYKDHGADVRIKAQSINGLFISNGACGANTHAAFTGTAEVTRSTGTTTENFIVEVDDCGEPGTNDTFRIQSDSYTSGPPKTLVGGNIQIHK